MNPKYPLPRNRIVCRWLRNTPEEYRRTKEFYAKPSEVEIEILTLHLQKGTMRYRRLKDNVSGDGEIGSLLESVLITIPVKTDV